MTPHTWSNIQPGDFGWDSGGGIIGKLIRHFSPSPYAHCWVYHEKIDDELWSTVEAYPGGVKKRSRHKKNTHRVMRVWRTQQEQQKILGSSEAMVGRKYAYGEVLRIIQYRLEKYRSWYVILAALCALAQIFVASLILLAIFALTFIPLPTNTKHRIICSNHVAQAALAARDDIRLSYPPYQIWPGLLEYDLNNIVWNDYQKDD